MDITETPKHQVVTSQSVQAVQGSTYTQVRRVNFRSLADSGFQSESPSTDKKNLAFKLDTGISHTRENVPFQKQWNGTDKSSSVLHEELGVSFCLSGYVCYCSVAD